VLRRTGGEIKTSIILHHLSLNLGHKGIHVGGILAHVNDRRDMAC
jgi:hypothetical protein